MPWESNNPILQETVDDLLKVNCLWKLIVPFVAPLLYHLIGFPTPFYFSNRKETSSLGIPGFQWRQNITGIRVTKVCNPVWGGRKIWVRICLKIWIFIFIITFHSKNTPFFFQLYYSSKCKRSASTYIWTSVSNMTNNPSISSQLKWGLGKLWLWFQNHNVWISHEFSVYPGNGFVVFLCKKNNLSTVKVSKQNFKTVEINQRTVQTLFPY